MIYSCRLHGDVPAGSLQPPPYLEVSGSTREVEVVIDMDRVRTSPDSSPAKAAPHGSRQEALHGVISSSSVRS